MDSGIFDIWSESTGLLSLFSKILLVPLESASALDNLVVALVTGPVGNLAICLPLSIDFLCNGGLSSFYLTLALESSEWYSMTMTFSSLTDGSNITLDFSLYLLETLVEFLLGY
jgi:hypothetical protein